MIDANDKNFHDLLNDDLDDKQFDDLLDFDLDHQRFHCWNILPPASPERLAAIKDSIADDTWTGRIVVDEIGRILYGHDDYRAFNQLKKPARHIFHLKVGDRCTREEVESLIRLWRFCDGGLATREERQEAIRHQLRIMPSLSNREIGRLLGTDKNTIQTQREQLEETGEIHQFLFPGGRGKKKGLPIVVSRDRKEAKKNARLLNARLLDARKLEGGNYSPRVLRQRKADQRRKKMSDLGKEMATPENIHLLHCDFRVLEAKLHDLGTVPGTVDLVWADMPWDGKALGLYPDLAKFVMACLKPNGLFACYTGTSFKDEANDLLRQHLPGFKKLAELIVVNRETGSGRMNGHFKSNYQPILLFTNGQPSFKEGFSDVVAVNREPKVHHPWQRTEAETEHWLTVFTEPGQLVVDPFGGGFTTAAICLRMGRRCVSCDLDEANVSIGKFRLNEVARGIATKGRK